MPDLRSRPARVHGGAALDRSGRRRLAGPRRLVAALAAVLLLAAAGCSGDDDTAAPGTTAPATTPPTTEPEPAPLEAGEQVYVYVPEDGDCFERRTIPASGGGSEDIVHLLPCELPHRQEVFAVIDYPVPADGSWPGEQAVRDWAQLQCPRFFEGYVGEPYVTSEIEISYILPTEESWPGVSTVACTLVDPLNRRVTGSYRGTGA